MLFDEFELFERMRNARTNEERQCVEKQIVQQFICNMTIKLPDFRNRTVFENGNKSKLPSVMQAYENFQSQLEREDVVQKVYDLNLNSDQSGILEDQILDTGTLAVYFGRSDKYVTGLCSNKKLFAFNKGKGRTGGWEICAKSVVLFEHGEADPRIIP